MRYAEPSYDLARFNRASGRVYKPSYVAAACHPSTPILHSNASQGSSDDSFSGVLGRTNRPSAQYRIDPDPKVMDKRTMLGEMACSLVSGVHGDAGVDRRSACVAYVSPNGMRTEQCGSLPVSQP